MTKEKWLKDLGLKLNKNKTELVHFYRKSYKLITLLINGTQIASPSSMNLLKVLLGSRLQWAQYVAGSLIKANKALNVIRLIRQLFNTKELLGLIT
jgi:hypothetical protein